MAGMMTKEEIHNERLDALARVFMRVNRVLSGGDVECTVVRGNLATVNAPAWNDGTLVTFNGDMIGNVTDIDDIIKVTGLNYHELSHIMFTPRVTTKMRKKVIDNGWHTAFNILEDQRIETLMTGMFKATEPYFVATFMSFCVRDEKSWETNHLLAHGRRYLSKKVRDEFARRFERQDLVQQSADIIDEYRMLSFRGSSGAQSFDKNERRGLVLIEEFNNLLNQINQQPGDPFGHVMRGEIDSGGEPVTKEEQQEASEWAEWYEDSDNDAEEGEGGKGKSDADEGDDESESDGSGDGDSEDGDDDGDESDGQGGSGQSGDSADDEEPEESTSPGGYTPGSGKAHKPTKGEFRDLLREEQEKAKQNEDVQREAKNTQSQIVHGDGKILPKVDMASYSERPADAKAMTTTSKFRKELERLRADLDPGWHTHKSSGRLNMKRAMNGSDIDTVFDVWDTGVHDATDIEAVLACDYSGSMAGSMDAACEAMWIIKRSLESVNGDVTVFGFSDDSVTLYDREQKALPNKYRRIGSAGGTDPTFAIEEGFRILANSRRQHKMFIFVTDGAWNYYGDHIDRMRKHGVTTACAYIGRYAGYQFADSYNGCEFGLNIQNPFDLVPFARRLVVSIMKNQKG